MWRLKLYRGIWCAVRRVGAKTERRSLHTKDRDAAERLLRDWTVKPTGDLICQIVPAYIADKTEQRARSCKAMGYSWKALQPTFGHLRPDQINRLLCRSYAISRRKGGAGNGTIIKDLGVLKAALGWAKMTAGAVFDFPPTPPPRDRYITRDEMEKLANAAEAGHGELFIRLAWATAARTSALLELTWGRVDFIRGQIRLATGEQGRKGRATVPMPLSLRSALETAYTVRGDSGHVIEWGGQPIKNVSKAFRRAHILRHSAAVAMAEAGVDLVKISQALGHSDPAVTFRVYARFRPEHMADVKAALE